MRQELSRTVTQLYMSLRAAIKSIESGLKMLHIGVNEMQVFTYTHLLSLVHIADTR